ncbi:MAG: ROK family protein [Kosmotoga sp.]|nr:MAG: ROK family protein [Kosmotoga sp.]
MQGCESSTKRVKCALAVDVGGTSLKYALVDLRGQITGSYPKSRSINSKGDCEEILKSFIDVFREMFKDANNESMKPLGISCGVPGPFDYKRGISLIKGLDKYNAIYGVNLKNEFRNRLNLSKNFPVLFEEDSAVFLRGEAWFGAAKNYNNIIGITLGTGFGSAFMRNRKIVRSGPGVPPLAWIGGIPYGEGIFDDYASKRGIEKNYEKMCNKNLGVKEIAIEARSGNHCAKEVFENLGELIGSFTRPIVSDFDADCVLMGGQISNAFDLFEHSLKKELFQSKKDLAIHKASDLDRSPILGAASLLFDTICN